MVFLMSLNREASKLGFLSQVKNETHYENKTQFALNSEKETCFPYIFLKLKELNLQPVFFLLLPFLLSFLLARLPLSPSTPPSLSLLLLFDD